MGRGEACLEGVFEKIGRAVGTHPCKSILGSVLVVVATGYGFTMIVNETRPEMQWVAKGALALEHNDYVKATWPSNARFDLFAATCADVDEAACNILEPKYIKRFYEINKRIMDIVVDGNDMVATIDAAHKRTESDDPAKRPWLQYGGNWTFMGKATSTNDTVVFEGRKCFSFGPFCGKSSVLDVFRDDGNVINNLNTDKIQRAVNFWEEQEGMCPLSIATDNSPCFDDNCQKYDTQAERYACRTLATTYCQSTCPTMTYMYKGEEVTVPVDIETCMDRGCIQLGGLSSMTTTTMPGMLNTDPGQAPESAFEFDPSPMKTMVGPLEGDGNVKYAKGKYLQGFWAITMNDMYCTSKGNVDPIADEWERRALCELGFNADPDVEPDRDCPTDELLDFSGLFGRSFGDEFGAAIQGDVSKLSSSYFVILIYCGVMIGKRDHVHSGIVLSLVVVLIVGLTISGTMGLMGLLGVPNSNLNNNLYFLILGLGVDDAFVLASEFTRHTILSPELSIPDRIALTAKTGGASVLITSATDAIAFLVGSSTVLPALGWFCTWAGTAIIFCFIFQLTVFLPVLALNARRAEANRFDCCCCFQTKKPRAIEDPQGCCVCCTPRVCGDNMLRRGLVKCATTVTTPPGQAATIIFFTVMAGVGIFGSTQVYKDFKLEWFIPDTSYVNEFFNINKEHFATGTPITINLRATPDAFAAQDKLWDLNAYLTTTELTNKDAGVTCWYADFMEWAVDPNQAQTSSAGFVPSRSDPRAAFADRSAFYTALHFWYRNTVGGRFRGSMLWEDAECNVAGTVVDLPSGCDVTTGLKASRLNAELTLASTDLGTNRYATMTTMRSKISELYDGAFPYSFDFLYWEEVGIIDGELMRNLAICGAVIVVIVCALVPVPRIAVWVVLCIVLSVIETLGFMYFWDVTISGVSTIYLLICVGLSVDYAAHIAHMFKESTGSPRERAIASVERIGPCTFNAVLSTLLAVIVVGFSASYVFRIFFKVLFLVVIIAGAHGLWLLPVLLSICGGSKEPSPAVVHQVKAEAGDSSAVEDAGVGA